MKVAARDLFALADALLVLSDDETPDITYRKKIASKLEEVYWKMLRAYHDQGRASSWHKSSFRRASPNRRAVKL